MSRFDLILASHTRFDLHIRDIYDKVKIIQWAWKLEIYSRTFYAQNTEPDSNSSLSWAQDFNELEYSKCIKLA